MILTALVLSTFLAPASAATDAEDADTNARVSSSEYIFETGDELNGDVLKPGDTHIRARRGNKHPTMVLIRANFVDRIHHQAKDM